MLRRLTAAVVVALALSTGPAYGEGTGGPSRSLSAPSSSSKSRSTKPRKKAEKHEHTTKAPAVATARDSRGRIKRSEAAKVDFMRQTGYPHGRPGYVVDHIMPLACGGADAPSNMQWQTVAEAKAKDKVERLSCR